MINFLATLLLITQTVEPGLRSEAESAFASAKAASNEDKLAGIYEQAVHVDVFAHVAITNDGKIAFERHGNSGLVEANVGTAKVDGVHVSVRWRYPEKHPHRPTVESEMILVPWGQALILVPESRFHRFCIDARENRDHIFDKYFVRKPPELKELVGNPTVPEKHLHLIALPEMIAKVVSADKQSFTAIVNDMHIAIQTVTLNKGLADHVYMGMELDCEKSGRTYVVTSIDRHTCVARSELQVKTKAVARETRQGWIFRSAR